MQIVIDAVFSLLNTIIRALVAHPKTALGFVIAWYAIYYVVTEGRELKVGTFKQRAAFASALMLGALMVGATFWSQATPFKKVAMLVLTVLAALIYSMIRLGGRFPSRKAWQEMRAEEKLTNSWREGVKRVQGGDAIVGKPRKVGDRYDIRVRTPKSVSSLAAAATDGTLGSAMNIAATMQGIGDGEQVRTAAVTRSSSDPEGTATISLLNTKNPLIGSIYHAPPIVGVTTDNGKRQWGTPIHLGDTDLVGAPMEVGISVLGAPIKLDTFENSIFVSGLTRSGKSMQISGIIRALAPRPYTALILGDGAGKPDCFGWGPRASSIAIGPNAVYRQGLWIIGEVKRRYAKLMNFEAAERGDWGDPQRKVVLGPDMPHLVVIWDEFGEVFKIGNFEAEFHSIATIALAAGVTIILATQRPDFKTVPTRIRSAIPSAIAFATKDRDHTEMACGTGQVPAHDVSVLGRTPEYRGIGYTVHQDSQAYTMFKSFFVPDGEIKQVADATAHLRVELEGLKHLVHNVRLEEDEEEDW